MRNMRRLFSSLPSARAGAGIPGGPGGRSSHQPNVITVFGATGMLGRYVVNELGRRGNTVIVATRGDDMEWRHLKLMGDLGKIVPFYYSPRDMDSVREAMQHSNVVVNLVGKRYETSHILPFIRNYTYYGANVEVAENIAQATADLGVDRLVHVSALAANKASSSEWARTKAIGEERVKTIRPDATIIRPATLYGQEDCWLNTIAWLARGRAPWLSPFVVGDGSQKVQPLWANNCGQAVARAALADYTEGQTYKIAGKTEYTQKEIVEFVLETIQTEVKYRKFSPPVAEALVAPFDLLPEPKIVPDNVRLMQEDVVLNLRYGEQGIEDLGVEPRAMEDEAYNFLMQYRRGTQFETE